MCPVIGGHLQREESGRLRVPYYNSKARDNTHSMFYLTNFSTYFMRYVRVYDIIPNDVTIIYKINNSFDGTKSFMSYQRGFQQPDDIFQSLW